MSDISIESDFSSLSDDSSETLTNYLEEAIPLIQYDPQSMAPFSLNPEAVHILKSLDSPIAVIGAVG